MEQRTLRTQSQLQDTQNYSQFLTILSIYLATRFQDVSDLQNDYEQVRRISDFCLFCSTVARESWEHVNEKQQQITRQSRVA